MSLCCAEGGNLLRLHQERIEARDFIVAINGESVSSIEDIQHFLTEWPIGQSTTVTVLRWEGPHDIVIVPEEAPPE